MPQAQYREGGKIRHETDGNMSKLREHAERRILRELTAFRVLRAKEKIHTYNMHTVNDAYVQDTNGKRCIRTKYILYKFIRYTMHTTQGTEQIGRGSELLGRTS